MQEDIVAPIGVIRVFPVERLQGGDRLLEKSLQDSSDICGCGQLHWFLEPVLHYLKVAQSGKLAQPFALASPQQAYGNVNLLKECFIHALLLQTSCFRFKAVLAVHRLSQATDLERNSTGLLADPMLTMRGVW